MTATTRLAERLSVHQPRGRSGPQNQAESEYVLQGEKLGFRHPGDFHGQPVPTDAAEAKFITPQDPVIETFEGKRLPAVPVEEAVKLNSLKDKVDGSQSHARIQSAFRQGIDGTLHGIKLDDQHTPSSHQSSQPNAPLRDAIAPQRTNPLFPPIPVFGPSSPLRSLQCAYFRCTSAVLSFCFLLFIVLGAIFTNIPPLLKRMQIRLSRQDPATRRPFYDEEIERQKQRIAAEELWQKSKKASKQSSDSPQDNQSKEYTPLEGGPDPLVCDARYYARRVGLEMEEFDVQTEDGFIIQLWHVFDPCEARHAPPPMRRPKSPTVFRETYPNQARATARQVADGSRRYPVLLMHGLLQSAGAYCCNDDNSLAFYLAKSGYDVWLGNNRCGFEPRHALLDYGDPRMWAWNIRQMGVLDLPALVSRVLTETGFPKLGLVAHSQGTTQTLVALAKEQRPDLGDKLSVFCALAPAAYAGPLIKKMYFKFMQAISPTMFRLIFGIHAFIPLMMRAHALLPARLYGGLGYLVFSFLFDWSDARWERALRARAFQFSPVFVSAESMRWWLGRECFAKQKCILSTRREGQLEDEEDAEERAYFAAQPGRSFEGATTDDDARAQVGAEAGADAACMRQEEHAHHDKGRSAWYDAQAPPFAFWVAGADDLVDGRRLLRRFETGREPHVDVVHSKIIEGYEHLDVIWAMDSIAQVGREVREVLWKTAPAEARRVCMVPEGCEGVEQWVRPSEKETREDGPVVDASRGRDGESLQGQDEEATADAPEP